MVTSEHEILRQIVGLSWELLVLAKNAYVSESEGKGSIMVYGFISDCASQLQETAEKRRKELSEIDLEGLFEKVVEG